MKTLALPPQPQEAPDPSQRLDAAGRRAVKVLIEGLLTYIRRPQPEPEEVVTNNGAAEEGDL